MPKIIFVKKQAKKNLNKILENIKKHLTDLIDTGEYSLEMTKDIEFPDPIVRADDRGKVWKERMEKRLKNRTKLTTGVFYA